MSIINNQHLREMMQIKYDNMIERSNLAFESSGNVTHTGTFRFAELTRSETLDQEAASIAEMMKVMGVPLEEKKSDRLIDLEVLRDEERQYEAMFIS